MTPKEQLTQIKDTIEKYGIKLSAISTFIGMNDSTFRAKMAGLAGTKITLEDLDNIRGFFEHLAKSSVKISNPLSELINA